jgi:hypothetical protein
LGTGRASDADDRDVDPDSFDVITTWDAHGGKPYAWLVATSFDRRAPTPVTRPLS